MRIYNIEDGVGKLYVQVGDIKMLVLDKDTPRSISNIICDITFNDNYDDNDFISFKKQSDILFLESHDWIIDYRDYKNRNIHEIKKEIHDLKQDVRIMFYNDKKEERLDAAILDYKALKLEEIVAIKKGYMEMDFPLVPDYKGFKLTSKDNEYLLNESLNPDKFLIYRKDGKQLSSRDRFRDSFIEMGISVALSNKVDNNEKVGKYSVIHSFTPDKKYLVTKINHVSKEKDNNKGFKGFVKKLLYKNIK